MKGSLSYTCHIRSTAVTVSGPRPLARWLGRGGHRCRDGGEGETSWLRACPVQGYLAHKKTPAPLGPP